MGFEFGLLLQLLAGSPVNLGEDLSKFHRDVRGVAVKNRGVTISDLPRMVKLAASFAGSSFEFEATKPRFRSFTATFLTLNPTLSPGRASWSASWCISTDLTSVVSPVGPKVTTVPGLITPGNINGNTTFTLSLELVKHPGILE
ncbi:hypothetical protein SADUNF_Sadunf08G0031500 [Salix dunnii]|uniref:Uncharacterized protein n=1 Tax=Salix dunnii TaxID=1413687 RepID=A0A835JSP2_9ROSI|nr:hypothetical protein SADUNF_Sadunf08G0031500 [Salix dunnii]